MSPSTFTPAQSKSALFRGQIVRQMVSAAAKSQKVSLDTVAGTQFATAGKSPVAVGSFDGNDAVVVLGRTGQNSLTLASGAAQAYRLADSSTPRSTTLHAALIRHELCS